MENNLDNVKRQAVLMASTPQGYVFGFSAGPMSNILIPLMWRRNPNNTYIDFGGVLDFEIHNVSTREFHSYSKNVRGTQQKNSTASAISSHICHQTRWNVTYEQTLMPSICPLSVSLRWQSR